MIPNASRRDYLKGATAVGAALLIGVRPDGTRAGESGAAGLNLFVRVGADGREQLQ